MMPETKLKSKKNTSQAPGGRKSWQDARNQVEGNIEWALEFMGPKEIIQITARKSQSNLVEENTVTEALLLKRYHEFSASKISNRLPENASLGDA